MSGIGPVDSFSTDGGTHLEIRNQDITASVAGALWHVHPYATTLRLYLEKRGTVFPNADNRVTRRGRWMEPAVAVALREEHPGWHVERAGIYLRDAALRLGATPDYLVRPNASRDRLGICQIKSVAPSVFRDQWLDGDMVPRWITIQNTIEVLLAEQFFGCPCFGVIAALVVDPFNMDLKVFDHTEDRELAPELVDKVTAFWRDVEFGHEPVPDFEKDSELIATRFPQETPGKIADLSTSNIVPELLQRRADVKARMAQDKVQCEVIESEIQYLMGDAEYVSGVPGWRVTWKVEPRKGYTVEPSRPRVLRIRRKDSPDAE
jgi:hypothetical protein